MKQECKIGMISGTGTEGQGIALRLAAAGLQIALGSRSLERAQQVAGELNRQLGQERVAGVDNRTLVANSDLLFLTVPFVHVDSVLQQYRDQFSSNQILVDVTVPVVFDKGPRLLDLGEGSGAEYIRGRLPDRVPLVAAFKTLPAHLLVKRDIGLECDDFISSDSVEAKEHTLEVVSKIPGLRWIDAGPLRACRALEAMTLLAVMINRRYKIKFARYRVLGLEHE
ncbi:MAG: NADPH-dependent F420 reductase [Acidobacteria bacterium]|nr:NADPH-dependent F420 reductase [Acidobacteriota bacterium]